MLVNEGFQDDVSLYYWLKNKAIGPTFSETLIKQPVIPVSGGFQIQTSQLPNPFSKDRGIIYYDYIDNGTEVVPDLSHEQTTQVTLYDLDNNIIPVDNYRVDYINGMITGVTGGQSPTKASFTWHYVSTMQGWPGENPPPLPIVSLFQTGQKTRGYQLGPGELDCYRYSIYIFATSLAERKELSMRVYKALYNKSAPSYDFATYGQPLNFDGTFNADFTGQLVSGKSCNMFFEELALNYIPSREGWDELNRYRSELKFAVEVYR